MNRMLASVSLVCCLACGVARADISSDLAAIRAVLPAQKAKLDQLKAAGQDISYPMISYTVLDNFSVYASSAREVSELQVIKADLDQQLTEALAGKRTLPKVPKWTGDTLPIIKGTSLLAPTTTLGNPSREIRPVFFTGFVQHSTASLDIPKWPDYGINLIQYEYSLFWTSLPIFASLKDDFELAKKHGLAVDLLIGPHQGAPPYPECERKPKTESFLEYCLHAPSGQEYLKQCAKALIAPIKDNPALHSVCLTNEPRTGEAPCPYATAMFQTWLQQRHGSIDVLNSRWGTSFSNFSEISVPNPQGGKPDSITTGEWYDYIRWNQEFFASWHKMLADAVHEVAPNVPVHAKVQGYTFGKADEVKCGNDPYLYASVTDINGNDGSNYYIVPGTYASSWMGCCMYGDLQRSMRDAPIFNSENHLFHENEYESAPPEHVRTALWQEAIHGQSATACWVWDYMEWPDNYVRRPLCTRAVGIANLDLNRTAKEVTALQQIPEQVTILHSPSSLIWDSGHEYDYLAMRTYQGLNFCRVRIGYITERQLEAGILPKTNVFVVPNARYISNAAFETLKKYQGHIIYLVSGSLLEYDEYGKPRSEKLANAEAIPFTSATDTATSDIHNALLPKLTAWGITPKYDLVDSSGKLITFGVEYREANMGDVTVVNICDYLTAPINVKLTRNGADVTATDVLTGETVAGFFDMKQFDFRLLKIKN